MESTPEKEAILVEAVKQNVKEVVEFLLAEGVRSGQAIYEAASAGHDDILDLLCETSPELVDFSPSLYAGTALTRAAERGRTETVRLLLVYRADATAFENTALRRAVDQNNLPLLEMLVEAGADVNACKGKPFRQAVLGEQEEMVQFMARKGARMYTDEVKALPANNSCRQICWTIAEERSFSPEELRKAVDASDMASSVKDAMLRILKRDRDREGEEAELASDLKRKVRIQEDGVTKQLEEVEEAHRRCLGEIAMDQQSYSVDALVADHQAAWTRLRELLGAPAPAAAVKEEDDE